MIIRLPGLFLAASTLAYVVVPAASETDLVNPITPLDFDRVVGVYHCFAPFIVVGISNGCMERPRVPYE
jgi:hypothetical protein